VNSPINGYYIPGIPLQILTLLFTDTFKETFSNTFKKNFDSISVDKNTITMEKIFEYKKDENGITLLTDIPDDLNNPIINTTQIFKTEALMVKDGDNGVRIVFPLPLVEGLNELVITYNYPNVVLEYDATNSKGVGTCNIIGGNITIKLKKNEDISIYFKRTSGEPINEDTFKDFILYNLYIDYDFDKEKFGTINSLELPYTFTIDFRFYKPEIGIKTYDYKSATNITWGMWIQDKEDFEIGLTGTIMYNGIIRVSDAKSNDIILHNAEYCIGEWVE
jgi:hypothetical protein